MHDGGEDVLRAVFLLGEAEDLLIEAAGVFIAAVFLEVRGVHIEDHLVEELGIRLQAAQGYSAVLDHLIQGRVIGQISAALEVWTFRGVCERSTFIFS